MPRGPMKSCEFPRLEDFRHGCDGDFLFGHAVDPVPEAVCRLFRTQRAAGTPADVHPRTTFRSAAKERGTHRPDGRHAAPHAATLFGIGAVGRTASAGSTATVRGSRARPSPGPRGHR